MKLRSNVSKFISFKTEARILNCNLSILTAGRIMTAEGADSSDEEGGSAAKKMKTAQPMVPESVAANIPSMGAVPMSTSMLTSPFMGMNPMTHYLNASCRWNSFIIIANTIKTPLPFIRQ